MGVVLLVLGLGQDGVSAYVYLLIGGILTFQAVIWLGVSLFGRNRAKARAATLAHLAQTGVRGQVQVLGLADTGVTINDNPRVHVTLQVTPQGGQPYQITKTTTVSRVAIPRVGDVYPALIDPTDPTKLAYGHEIAQLTGGASFGQPPPAFGAPTA